MESILKAIKKKKIPINPAVVISNKPNAKGLAIAKKMGVQIEIVDSSKYKGKRLQYDKKNYFNVKKIQSNSFKWTSLFGRIYENYQSILHQRI